MNKQEYLLTDEAIYKRCKWRSIPTMQDVARIQLKHTLEQLEEGEMLVHKPIEHYSRCRNTICGNPNCWCAALREVEGK